MKLEEIAQILDENVNTVKSRLYRSIQKLRIKLEDDDAGLVRKRQEKRKGGCQNERKPETGYRLEQAGI